MSAVPPAPALHACTGGGISLTLTAFTLFVAVYAPILVRPRADVVPGYSGNTHNP
jgi:hypothetical protein